MTDDEKWSIRAARHTWVITDPYPDITKNEQEAWVYCFLNKLVSKKESGISVHRAWMDGFNFAWKLVEDKLNAMPTDKASWEKE